LVATPDLTAGALACLVLAACWGETTPAPVRPTSRPVTEPRAARSPLRDLSGSWLETFGTRSGCSDTTTIVAYGAALDISGVDCNDSSSYAFEEVSYDGLQLSLRLSVPATGFGLLYTLRWSGDDELAGEATAAGGGGPTYPVRWSRQR
jgi:hypothetical protein